MSPTFTKRAGKLLLTDINVTIHNYFRALKFYYSDAIRNVMHPTPLDTLVFAQVFAEVSSMKYNITS